MNTPRSADIHWLAKMLVDQGATDCTCSNMPKGIAVMSVILSTRLAKLLARHSSATETLVPDMLKVKGIVHSCTSPSIHWLAKTLARQGATNLFVANLPKGCTLNSATSCYTSDIIRQTMLYMLYTKSL